MGKKLFVGNLSCDTTSADLEALFSQAGTCESASVITDRATGRSRGFGFVEMSSASEAERAITELNGHELQGRKLNVSEAREGTGGAGGGRGGGGRARSAAPAHQVDARPDALPAAAYAAAKEHRRGGRARVLPRPRPRARTRPALGGSPRP